MGRIIDSLNQNTGVLSLLFGAVVAIATVFYARLTRALVAETKRMREAQTEPQLLVQVEISSVWVNFVNICVRNIGAGPAYDVTLTLDRDIVPEQGPELSSWGPFKHGISFLAPGQVHTRFLTSLVGQLAEIERSDGRYSVAVTASYANAVGERQTRVFPLDFRQFVGLTTIGTPPDQEAAKALTKIQEDLSRLASGASRLRVDTYTSLDRIQDQMRWERRMREEREAAQKRDEGDDKGAGA